MAETIVPGQDLGVVTNYTRVENYEHLSLEQQELLQELGNDGEHAANHQQSYV